jgi:hypothetical protein
MHSCRLYYHKAPLVDARLNNMPYNATSIGCLFSTHLEHILLRADLS